MMFVPEPKFRAPIEVERLVHRAQGNPLRGAVRDELAALVRSVLVRMVTADKGLELKSQMEGRGAVNKRVSVEAEASDKDGGTGVGGDTIHMLRHVFDGRRVELEFYSDNGGTAKRLPPLSVFELIVLPPAPKNGWPCYGKRI